MLNAFLRQSYSYWKSETTKGGFFQSWLNSLFRTKKPYSEFKKTSSSPEGRHYWTTRKEAESSSSNQERIPKFIPFLQNSIGAKEIDLIMRLNSILSSFKNLHCWNSEKRIGFLFLLFGRLLILKTNLFLKWQHPNYHFRLIMCMRKWHYFLLQQKQASISWFKHSIRSGILTQTCNYLQ